MFFYYTTISSNVFCVVFTALVLLFYLSEHAKEQIKYGNTLFTIALKGL